MALRPCFFFFFNDTATTEIYTLSLHDALPIYPSGSLTHPAMGLALDLILEHDIKPEQRSEEHTSELQSRSDLVCRLLLEKKKNANLMIQATGSLPEPHSVVPTQYYCQPRTALP